MLTDFLVVELSPSSYLQRKQANGAKGIMVYKQLALKVIDNLNCYDASVSGERSWNVCSMVLKALFPCWLQKCFILVLHTNTQKCKAGAEQKETVGVRE